MFPDEYRGNSVVSLRHACLAAAPIRLLGNIYATNHIDHGTERLCHTVYIPVLPWAIKSMHVIIPSSHVLNIVILEAGNGFYYCRFRSNSLFSYLLREKQHNNPLIKLSALKFG